MLSAILDQERKNICDSNWRRRFFFHPELDKKLFIDENKTKYEKLISDI
jgi:hypothetical protein